MRAEISECLSEQKQIKGLKFKHFSINPTKGNLIELELPSSLQENFGAIKQHFKPGAWIDLTIDKFLFGGFVFDIDNKMVTLGIKDIPPASIHDDSDITLSLPDDRFVLGEYLIEIPLLD